MMRVCTGYTEVEYSPPPIYYELLILLMMAHNGKDSGLKTQTLQC